MAILIGAGLTSAVLLTGCTAGNAGLSTGHPARNQAQQAAHKAGPGALSASKGQIGMITCEGAVLGEIAAARPGLSTASLGDQVRVQISDSVEGRLAMMRANTVDPSSLAGTPFSRAANVMAQSADPRLRSCDYLLSDRTAAQPFIAAAISAAVSRRLAPSAAALRSDLQIVTISDNPLREGSLIVTLFVPGPLQSAAASGTPALYALNAIVVVMNRAGLAVTGAGTGNL